MPNNNDRGNGHEKNSLSDQGRSMSIGAMSDQWSEEIEHEMEADRVRRVAEDEKNAADAEVIRKEPDIVKRAGRLFSTNQISFPDVKAVKQGPSFITQPLMTDDNMWTILDQMFSFGRAEDSPHLDTYRGRYVDEAGTVVDKRYPIVRWVRAFAAGGLKGVAAKRARDAIVDWMQQHEQNDLIERLKALIPAWDGIERCETYLFDMFDAADTKCNREFGKYFWRSLYCRTMVPGALAPMVLCLFGGQGLGKSRFGNEIAKAITGDPKAIAIQWDLDGDHINFLRNITGHSVIASIGEMGGMEKAEWNKVKQRITLESDPLNYKFEPEYIQRRQWIAVLDANSYHGIQRDDTGNRRFKGLLCGHKRDEKGNYMWDEKGHPVWREGFVIAEEKWAAFRTDLWQLLAEAAEWVKSNGMEAYNAFVQQVSQLVFEENAKERAANRGTSRNPDIETYGRRALHDCAKKVIGNVKKRGENPRVWVGWSDFVKAFKRESGQRNPNQDSLRPFLTSMGGMVVANAGYAGYVFAAYPSIEAMNDALDPNSMGPEYEVLDQTPEPFDEG